MMDSLTLVGCSDSSVYHSPLLGSTAGMAGVFANVRLALEAAADL